MRNGLVELCKGHNLLMRSLIFPSLFAGGRICHVRRMLMSTSSSPWLMLPPGRSTSSGEIIHNFYSLSGKKRLSFDGGFPLEDGTRFVGSSHGWLALFNARNNHLFLTNPLSGRRIDLPAVDKLPDPKLNLRNGRASVSKLILSCSPDDGGGGAWRALMTFGLGNRLAMCSADEKEWKPIGRLFKMESSPNKQVGRNYEDFVYCRRSASFICAPYNYHFDECTETEYWFVGDDSKLPQVTSIVRPDWADEITEEFATALGRCLYIPHLVYVEHLNQLLLVVRFVVDDDDYYTVRFAVFRLDDDKVRWVRPGEALNGLAMFVGINHSFALAAADFPNIKPNSIYFTHCNWNFTSPDSLDGCDDIGIFDFEKQSLSCRFYRPSPVETIGYPPLWFNPPTPHPLSSTSSHHL